MKPRLSKSDALFLIHSCTPESDRTRSIKAAEEMYEANKENILALAAIGAALLYVNEEDANEIITAMCASPYLDSIDYTSDGTEIINAALQPIIGRYIKNAS